MNGYSKIILASVVLLIISIINENNTQMHYVIWSNPNFCQYFCIYFIRLVHYFCFLYASCYLFFFNGIGNPLDVYIYLFSIFIITFGWYAFESCWMSYIELLYYGIDAEKIETTFHPTFHSIFNKYTSNTFNISGFLYLFTVSLILYKTNAIPVIYKFLYYIIFLWLFLDGTLCTWKKYSAKKNKNLAAFKTTYDNYLSKMCSCSK